MADYTLLLKNGGRIVVEDYHEEDQMIKFPGFGGKIGVGKDQIQAIRKGGDERPTLDLTQPQPSTPVPTKQPAAKQMAATPQVFEGKTPGAEETLSQQRVKKQRVLEAKLKEVTDKLRQLRERYAAQTTGVVGPEPDFFTSEEAFRGHQEDLLSRLRDAQYRAQGLPTGDKAASPPAALNPPPPYTQKQKELSELRSQINQLEKERQRLIEEMKLINPDLSDVLRE
ncbi:MAG TPA: hypothetical protein VFU31_27690 [Candidatus Binatia bacterium]|nr:hypothetical protein [Candidatus Binatia bacterium]